MARLVFIAALILAQPLIAQGQSAYRDVGSIDRFFAYNDNFALWHRMQNNGWAGDDEWALRGHYSFRYDIYDSRSLKALKLQAYDQPSGHTWFLSYTGEFDFYMNTRPSGPVINRVSNPGAHYRYSWPKARYLEGGIEHRSDGQVGEVTNPRDAQLAQQAYLNRDRSYFDQISRGSDFISLAGKYSTDGSPDGNRATDDKTWTFYAKARVYLDQDTKITWGPLAGRNTRISDYDRLTFRVIAPDRWFGQFEVQTTLGDKLGNSSYEAAYQLPEFLFGEKFSIPLFVRFHSGPMNTLSNYTQRQNSIGIGLRLTWVGKSEARVPGALFQSTQ